MHHKTHPVRSYRMRTPNRLGVLTLTFGVIAIGACSDPEAVSNNANKTASKSIAETPLKIDPLLIAEAAEVWSLIAIDNNEIWPGWNAADTPILLYLPNQQDVLINHPRPSYGFSPYRGPLTFPGSQIHVRDGNTLIKLDGQNTSRYVGSVRTLVVADTLSNRKLNIGALIQDSRPATEKVNGLDYDALTSDPYDTMAMIAHEAFHVYQDKKAPNKGGNESSLSSYPFLSVRNNVGFALEGAALADAMRASDDKAVRSAAMRWLAVRLDRRSELSEESIAYEDGTEFNEGLAKYIEFRMIDAWRDRTPSRAMYWAQGFHGYGDLDPIRERMIDRVVDHMNGDINVNNDPYGASPLRMRLYFSGMGVAALLDKVSDDWKTRIFDKGVTLTKIAQESLNATSTELSAALSEAKGVGRYDALVRSKEALRIEGTARIKEMLSDIRSSPNGSLTIDYSALGDPKIGLSYTPFGVTGVDEDRTIYRMVPVRARIGNGYTLTQTTPSPLLQDRKRHQFVMAFTDPVSAEQLSELSGAKKSSGAASLHIELPGVKLSFTLARARVHGRDVEIVLER